MRTQAPRSRLFPQSTNFAVVMAVMVIELCGVPAPAAYRDGFDTPTPSWQLADSDCGAQLVLRERTFQQPQVHAGVGAEFLRLSAGHGSYAYVTHSFAPARVIHELRPTLWVKSNRPGLQLRARVVLPRSRDPRNGAPLTIFVDGDIYQQPGVWRQLTIADIPLQVQRQARIKRAQPQFGSEVDERESYIDMIVLNAYGGAGVTDVWIDDLEIAGYSEAGIDSSVAVRQVSDPEAPWQLAPTVEDDHPTWDGPPGQEQPPHLEGSTLIAGHGPVAVRMIEHQGEPFAWLKALGFNAIRLPRPPTREELDEARRVQIGLVAPPPHVTGRTEITPAHDVVWAWDLGSGLGVRELESTRRLAQAVRRDAPHSARPLLVGPLEATGDYRRFANILLLGHQPLGTSRGIDEFQRRLTQAARPASRSGPIWAFIQTEPSREIVDQLDAVAGNAFDIGIEAAQVRLLVLSALEAGATGFCFRSRSRLDGSDPCAQHRTAVLQAVNRELILIEPWLAGPAHQEMHETGVQGIVATSWSTDRSKLMLLSQRSADDQFAAAACPTPSTPLLISGAPPSWKVYRLAANRLAPLWASQTGGGMRIVVPEVGRSTFLVATDDPLTVNFLSRRLRQSLAGNAKLRHEIISHELSTAKQVLKHAPADSSSREQAMRHLDDALASLRRCEFLLDASDFSGSLTMAQAAEHGLERMRRLVWSEAVAGFASRSASPCCVGFAALPLHWALEQRVRAASWGPNSLAGGDFENFQHLLATGWSQFRDPAFEGQTLIELSPKDPKQGQYALRLHVADGYPRATHGDAVERPPVRVVSAPTPIARGGFVRVTGWVRVTAPGADDRPRLRISDSLGGDALEEYHRPTQEWRQFAFYRAANRPAQLTVTFELLGPGDAWIDDVRVEPLLASAALTGGSGPPPHQGAQRFSAGKPETFTH